MGEYTAPIFTAIGTIVVAAISGYAGVQVAVQNNEQLFIIKQSELEQSNTFKALEIIKDRQTVEADKWAVNILKKQEEAKTQKEQDNKTEHYKFTAPIECSSLVIQKASPPLPFPDIQAGDDARMLVFLLAQIIRSEQNRLSDMFKSIRDICKIDIPDYLIDKPQTGPKIALYWEKQIENDKKRVSKIKKEVDELSKTDAARAKK